MIQLAAELDWIMQKGVSQDIKEGWGQMIPKVITVAKEERENQNIEALLSTAPDNISDGKLLWCLHNDYWMISHDLFLL